MDYKFLRVDCHRIFQILYIQEMELDEDYIQNPTKEKRERLAALSQKIIHYEAYTRGKPMVDCFN
jgi:hypothetical protein